MEVYITDSKLSKHERRFKDLKSASTHFNIEYLKFYYWYNQFRGKENLVVETKNQCPIPLKPKAKRGRPTNDSQELAKEEREETERIKIAFLEDKAKEIITMKSTYAELLNEKEEPLDNEETEITNEYSGTTTEYDNLGDLGTA